jgi:hypothetical protein
MGVRRVREARRLTRGGSTHRLCHALSLCADAEEACGEAVQSAESRESQSHLECGDGVVRVLQLRRRVVQLAQRRVTLLRHVAQLRHQLGEPCVGQARVPLTRLHLPPRRVRMQCERPGGGARGDQGPARVVLLYLDNTRWRRREQRRAWGDDKRSPLADFEGGV